MKNGAQVVAASGTRTEVSHDSMKCGGSNVADPDNRVKDTKALDEDVSAMHMDGVLMRFRMHQRTRRCCTATFPFMA